MSATLTLDTAGFRRALTALQDVSALSFRQVVRAEAGSILKACAGDTKVSTVARADIRSRLRLLRDLGYTQAREAGAVTINAGLRGERGRIWLRTSTDKFKLAGSVSDSGRTRWENKHFSAIQWADIQDAVADFSAGIRRALSAGRAAIGLSRQSWVQIADSLGIALESVPGGRISAAGLAKARRAIASTGQVYANGTAQEYASARSFFIEMRNRLPYGRAISLDAILVKNVNARVRYFEQNLARGVFDKLSAVARAYPGLDVRRN